MKKVIVSACLLGHLCRYDGKTKSVDAIVEKFKNHEIIPFCPEAPLFGIPRERINVVDFDGDLKIITDETNKDVTKVLKKEIDFFVKQNPDANLIILKSKSPSCGLGTTPILNKNKQVLKYGNGMAVDVFKSSYKNTHIVDENFFI